MVLPPSLQWVNMWLFCTCKNYLSYKGRQQRRLQLNLPTTPQSTSLSRSLSGAGARSLTLSFQELTTKGKLQEISRLSSTPILTKYLSKLLGFTDFGKSMKKSTLTCKVIMCYSKQAIQNVTFTFVERKNLNQSCIFYCCKIIVILQSLE